LAHHRGRDGENRRALGVTDQTACAKEAPMINFATSYFWYFGYDSSLAVGGSRSI
jgi:hypothetical protein